jgi:hypothetical protein
VTRRLIVATLFLTLAVVAILLAADVRSSRSAFASGDALAAQSPGHASWTPHTRLGGLATDLLGTRDDLAVRHALQLYAVAAATHLRLDNATEVQTARAAAQDALTRVAASRDTIHSSQARTLLGVLTFRSSATGAEGDQVDAAVAAFTDAVRADGRNDEAKFDLELLLKLSTAHGTRPGQGVGGGFGRGAHRGAGGGTPGKGY